MSSWFASPGGSKRRRTGERPDFVAVLRRRPAVRVELGPPAEFARLLVTVQDAEAAVSRLRGEHDFVERVSAFCRRCSHARLQATRYCGR